MVILAIAMLVMQDGYEERIKAAGEAMDRARREYRMSLVELGPDAIPALEKRPEGEWAVAEIRRLQEPIEKLIKQLAAPDHEAREAASAGLLKIGRPARPYLEKSRNADDAEVRSRSEILIILINPSKHDRLHWKRVAEHLERKLRFLETEYKKGLTTQGIIMKVRHEISKARCKAGFLPVADYLRETRGLLEEEMKQADQERARGLAGDFDVLRIRLRCLQVDRRMGKDVEAELNDAVLKSIEKYKVLTERGLAHALDVHDLMLKISADPDDDLD